MGSRLDFRSRHVNLFQRALCSRDYGLSAAYAVLFMGIVGIMAIFYARLIRRSERYAVIRGRGFNPTRYPLGKWRFVALGLFAVYFLLTVAAPVLVLAWASLLPYYMAPSLQAFGMISFKHYAAILSDPRFMTDFLNTIFWLSALAQRPWPLP